MLVVSLVTTSSRKSVSTPTGAALESVGLRKGMDRGNIQLILLRNIGGKYLKLAGRRGVYGQDDSAVRNGSGNSRRCILGETKRAR